MNALEINKKSLIKVNNEIRLPSRSAALHTKCPRYRRGDFFATSMYGFKAQKTHDTYNHCNLKFEREPGYWYVALFVSYAMNVAELITLAVATYLITGNLENPYLYIAVLFGGTFLLSPINFRYSRVVLLYWLTPGLNFNAQMSRDKTGEA